MRSRWTRLDEEGSGNLKEEEQKRRETLSWKTRGTTTSMENKRISLL